MQNALPVMTLILGGTTIVLLTLLGCLFVRYTHKKRLHQAEIDTLMQLANGRQPTLPATDPEPGMAVAGDAPQTIAALEAKIVQLRRDYHKLGVALHEHIERTDRESAAVQRELQRLGETAGRMSARPGKTVEAPTPAVIRPAAEPPIMSAGAEPADPPPPADPDYVLDADTLSQIMGRPSEYGVPSSGIDVEEITIGGDAGEPAADPATGRSNVFDRAAAVFFQSSATEQFERGWYFNREGAGPEGPFPNKQSALKAMAAATLPPAEGPRLHSG